MQRVAFKMKLKPECSAEYIRRHNAIWPELKQLLTNAGIGEYSIFLDNETDTLFAFQKVSGDGGSQDLEDDPIVQRWWAYMADLMETNADNSPMSTPLEEVFFLE